MILLWGLAGDRPLASVRAKLASMGRAAVLLDQRAILDTRVELHTGGGIGGWIEWGAIRLDLARVRATYIRPYDPCAAPSVIAAGVGGPAGRHAVEVFDTLRVWSEIAPVRVINRMSAMGSNGSKPYQLDVIRRAGFEVPATIVTTDPEAVLELRRAHGQLIYKSVSGVRSIVSRLGEEQLGRLATVTSCPTQFQAWVPGVDVRVHVVGDTTFACELVADVDDYRYADRQGGKVERRHVRIPDEIASRCIALARSLGLPVAGIDLRRTPDGRWVCFEVNPSPAFSWFDTADEAIAGRLAALLAAED